MIAGYRLCTVNSLDEAKVKGKIVLCDAFPRYLAGLSRAAGFVFPAITSKDATSNFPLPFTVLSQNDGTLIRSYLNSTRYVSSSISLFIHILLFRSNKTYIIILL